MNPGRGKTPCDDHTFGRRFRPAVRQFAGPAAGRAKILQSAFRKALTDPDFQAHAKERKFDINPLGGEELEALAREVIAQPPEVIERMKRLLEK